MTTQFIEFTLPVEIDGGYTITEIDCAVEVKVTDRGKAVSYWSPAEGPEWEEVAYWVYTAGKFDAEKKTMEHKWFHAPKDIEVRMNRYLAGRKGWEIVADAIREDA